MSSDYEKYLEEKRKQKKNGSRKIRSRLSNCVANINCVQRDQRKRRRAAERQVEETTTKKIQIENRRVGYETGADTKKETSSADTKKVGGRGASRSQVLPMIFQVSETEYIPKVRKKGRDWSGKCLSKSFKSPS